MTIGKKFSIFIVEDDFMYSYMLERILNHYANYKLSSFESGEDCIQLLDNKPDMIILDYVLKKKMNGLDTLRAIKGKYPAIPVIILSSQENIKISEDLVKEGAYMYISKRDNAINKLMEAIIKLSKGN